MCEYCMATILIPLNNLKAVNKRMSVAMRLQLLGQIVVVQALVTIVP